MGMGLDSMSDTAFLTSTSLKDHSIDLVAEKSVLGVLLRKIEFLDVAAQLKPDHFYDGFHRHVFAAIADLAVAAGAVDPLTVYDYLRNKGWDRGKGDVRGYLFELVESAGHVRNLEAHVSIVLEKALVRRLRAATKESQEIVFNSRDFTGDDMLAAINSIFSKVSSTFTRNEPLPLQGKFGALVQFVERLDERSDGSVSPNIVPTYLSELDEMLNGGVVLGNTYVIGSRPSMGKTSLAATILVNQALNGWAVGVLSLEMTQDEFTGRVICICADMDFKPLAKGKLTQEEWARLTAGIERLNEAEFFIDDDPMVGLFDVEAKARSMIRQSGGKLKVLAIDYLQLMSGDNPNRSQMLGEISRGLKRLAKNLGIAIIELSQLNRNIDHRPDKRPMLADLRESGDIEADADVVIMPYREVKDNNASEFPDVADIYITKHRNGPTGWLPLKFISTSMKFVDWDGPEIEEFEQRKRSVGVVRRNRFEN